MGAGSRRSRSVGVDLTSHPQETGIPLTWSHYSQQRALTPDKNGRSWGSVDAWARRWGFGPAGHTRTHTNKTTLAGYIEESVTARLELEEYLPSCRVQYATLAGVGGDHFGGFKGRTLEEYTDLEYGRLMLQTYGGIEGRLAPPGDVLWPLDGNGTIGMRRFDIEQLNYYQVRPKIEEAIEKGMGISAFCHPGRIGYDDRFMTIRHYESLMKWIANQRDWGNLIVGSLDGMAVADKSHSDRYDLITNGDFSEGTDAYDRTGWRGEGTAWRVRRPRPMVSGDPLCMSTRGVQNATLRQTIDVPEAARGALFTLSLDAWVTYASGPVTIRMYINGGDIDRRFSVPVGQDKPFQIVMPQVIDRARLQYNLGIDVPDPRGGTVYVTNVRMLAT